MTEATFTTSEIIDVMNAADERGISPQQLLHDAVMADLFR